MSGSRNVMAGYRAAQVLLAVGLTVLTIFAFAAGPLGFAFLIASPFVFIRQSAKWRKKIGKRFVDEATFAAAVHADQREGGKL